MAATPVVGKPFPITWREATAGTVAIILERILISQPWFRDFLGKFGVRFNVSQNSH